MIYPEWLLWATVILPIPLAIFYCIMATVNDGGKLSNNDCGASGDDKSVEIEVEMNEISQPKKTRMVTLNIERGASGKE